ncbi:NUDIX hydrolase [Jeotgalibacillus soli]|uniref:Nudix hydrolase domain-containing protein n=1 Tax=Jeotgalibacillus soli TaxID=889306 RepID=A0A0C2VSS2_9BACL|nr:hypothetical protein [Jeotgalibacillus soli]KIL51972.1 hypothetical protein KP78_03420 [Jeotgalibacillus soli]
MKDEQLNIFDEKRNHLGTAARDEVHQKGYWHETFHCWLISKSQKGFDIYFQIRSDTKQDFPCLLDITAAGHLLAHETVEDGIREVREELGIDLSFDELHSLGIIINRIHLDHFLDNEFSHTYLSVIPDGFFDFTLQKEEVAGVVKASFRDFSDMVFGQTGKMPIQGFEFNEHGIKEQFDKSVGIDDLVPHEMAYLKDVVKLIERKLKLVSS